MTFTQTNTAKDIQDSVITPGQVATEMTPELAMKLGRECFESSTEWLDTSRKGPWNDSLRAFQGLHPTGSKYLSGDYKYRSRLFRPKSRAMVRKAEAATSSAFFANEDVVNITAQDDSNKTQQASSKIMERLLQYRLTKTIPWFQTLVGARQDAEVMGVCFAKVYWKYGERLSHTEDRPKLDPESGLPMLDETGSLALEQYDIYHRTDDHPWIDLISPENFRFDPGADWRNPIATSPYTVELIPMYVADVKAKVDAGEWKYVSDSQIMSATNSEEATRYSREQNRVPGKDADRGKPRMFDICWIRENIIRFNGKDWHFFSLNNSGELLTDPKALTEIYLQGIRPYVCGTVLIEAHKTYPSSKIEITKDLQTQTNDVTNLRLDNVKLALMPRQFVKGGQGIDPQDMRVFMPGKTVITSTKDDPRNVILWDRPPEVTASSFQEQDRLSMDFEELVGGVSNASIQGNRQVYEAVGNMELMAGNGSQIEEYDQRVFSETFVEPIIRHLVKLEQAYETDPVILAIAGTEAQLWQKFGVDHITDELLKQELTVKVNVGIGATNPKTRLQNFLTATQAIAQMYGPLAAQASNPEEVVSEIFGLCGYKDGKRFFQEGFDFKAAMQNQPNPEQAKAEAQMKIAQSEQEAQAKQDMLSHQMEMKQKQMDAAFKEREMQMQFYYKMQEMQAKNQTEMQKHRISTEAAAKPSTMVQFDANDALSHVGRNIEGMAQKHGQALDGLAQILHPIAQASMNHGKHMEGLMAHNADSHKSLAEGHHALASAIERLAKVTAAPRRLEKDAKGNKRTVIELENP
jgi:hypothetical protein